MMRRRKRSKSRGPKYRPSATTATTVRVLPISLLLKEFLEWALPHTTLSSVVASELLAGARTESSRRLVERDLLGAFERRGRIVAPSAAAWAKTGVVLGRAATAGTDAETPLPGASSRAMRAKRRC